MRLWHIGAVCVAIAAGASACSLILNWNPNGLPCEFDASVGTEGGYTCLPGYSCALRSLSDPTQNTCIEDFSILPNHNCQKDRQCTKGFICPAGTCQQACDPNNAYTSPTGCSLGQYCKPFYSTSMYSDRGTHTATLTAACVPSDTCTAGSPCDPNDGTPGTGACVAINSSANACALGCDITFSVPTTFNSYQEHCLGQNKLEASCEAVGPSGSQVTVCVLDYPAPLVEGQACTNPVAQPCGTGLTCINGKCAYWCPITTSQSSACATGQYCCAANLTSAAGTQLGYCVNGSSAACTSN